MRRYKMVLLVALVVGVGIFLRSYNFADWMHFELDQSRDAKVVLWSIENGIETLPLLGPRAGGTYLRLGPAFYYFEYIGAKIFGNTPQGMAAPTLFFSILSMPIFFIFVRRYFDEKISIGLLTIFATSLFLIMYSRFAWNPNTLIFFNLLFIYALLKAFDKEEKLRPLWLIVATFAMGIGMQLHFLAFIVLPVIAIAFVLIKRPKFKASNWIYVLLVILIIFSPVIINDIKTDGANAKEFFKAISGKSDKNKNNLAEKAIRNYTENSIAHWMIISSQEKNSLPKVSISGRPELISVICDATCKKNILNGIFGLILFTSGFALLVRGIKKESNIMKRDFLIINLVLFTITFGIFTPIAYDLSPRFFILIAPLAFVFLGLILEFISKKFKGGWWVVLVIMLALIVSNFSAIKKRFFEMDNSPFQEIRISPDRIMKEKARVTLEQQNMIVDYIESFYKHNGYITYVDSESFYKRAFFYHINQRNLPNNEIDIKKVYKNGNYFLIYRTSSNYQDSLEKYRVAYDIGEIRKFGTLSVIRIFPKDSHITANVQQEIISDKSRPKTGFGVPARYSWDSLLDD